MSFFSLTYSTDRNDNSSLENEFVQLEPENLYKKTIRFAPKSDFISIKFLSTQYKKKKIPNVYDISEKRTLIFLIGMCYLSDSQRTLVENVANKMDEEYIPDLYRIGGIQELTKLSGEHNLIVINEATGDIECISSHFGLLPLYYAQKDENFYLSNDLAHLGKISNNSEFNLAVLAQIALYNYSISDKTLLKNCNNLPLGSILTFKKNKLDLTTYWSPLDLLGKRIINNNQAFEFLDEKFNSTVKRFANQVESCALSLTGGWDGRLGLAYLLHHIDRESIQLYSFGTEDSPDVVIPKFIAEKMKLNYSPIILDEEYIKNSFLKSAKHTALESDGNRSIQRAHYYYAMNKLSINHTSIMSGICGSNIMKSAPTSPSLVYNSRILELLSSSDYKIMLKKHYGLIKSQYPLIFDLLNEQDFIESIACERMNNIFSLSEYSHRFSSFVLSYLERKYFGYELASYQNIIGNYSPFIDIDFVTTLSNTEYFNAYRYKNKVFAKLKNSTLYAKMIYKQNPELAKFISDRNVSLSDLLNPLNYPRVIVKQLLQKKKLKNSSKNYYNTTNTVDLFFAQSDIGDLIKDLNIKKKNDMIGSILTSLYWYKENFHNEKN
jgi:uncharacterized protein YjfI (DUF2170 family)